MKKRKLFNENYDPRDEEYVPEFEESPENELDLEKDDKQYVIIGTSEWGDEVLDYARTAEEAEELVKTYEISFGDQWKIDWELTSEYDFKETEMLEDEDIIEDDYDINDFDEEDEEYWTDVAGDTHTFDEEDPAKMYENIIMKPLK